MADYFQRFLVVDVPQLFERILQIGDEASSRGLVRVAADLDILVRDLSIEMDTLALSTAEFVDARAVELLHERRKRGETDSNPHLADVIKSDVVRGPLAEVGIADLATLAQARRRGRTTGGEYWRAQEFGLEQGFVGRHLHGVFTPSGTSPGPSNADTGFQVTSPDGGDGAWMTIRHPIEPKHFLTDATHEAAVRYARELRRIVAKADRRILAITARIPPAPVAAERSATVDYLLRNRRR